MSPTARNLPAFKAEAKALARSVTSQSARLYTTGSSKWLLLSPPKVTQGATKYQVRNTHSSALNRMSGLNVYNNRVVTAGNAFGQNRVNGLGASQRRTMFIQTSTTPNEDALKFLPSQRVLPESYGTSTLEYLSGRDAHSSPLARKLFAIDGVKSVMLGSDWLTVEKVKSDETNADSTSWQILKPEVFSVLTEHLSAGLPVVVGGTHAAADTAVNDDDDEVVSMIKELIDTRIRPAIQEDGGDIVYMGFTDEGVVQLKLQGACRSCDSSSVTLKNGIESMLMHYIEEVSGVEQVLDPEEENSIEEFKKFEKKFEQQKENSTPPPSL